MDDARPSALPAGRYETLPKAVYHADPCALPSLSSHIATTLLERSPRHAWFDHPRLNPAYKPKTKKIFDLGHMAHGLMLSDPETQIKIIQAKSWATKLVKAARDDYRRLGFVPILAHQANQIAQMVNAGQLQINASTCADAFDDGLPEQTLIWTEETQHGPIWCRARLDWFPNKGRIFYDYKTTGGSAHPDAFYSSAWDLGYYFQSAFYMRGIRATTKVQPAEFRFVIQETSAPFALSICALTPAGIAEADDEVERAIDLWGWCIKNNKWPGYTSEVAYVDPPPWVQRRREARKARDEILTMNGVDPREAMIQWQSPL